METTYDPKAWVQRTTLGRHIFNYNYHMLGGEVAGWQLLKTVVMNVARTVTEKTYIWQNLQAPNREMVRVGVAESHDWRQAQRFLLEMLGHCMRPHIAQGTGLLSALGDVNFVARDPRSDLPAAIQFTRGNVAVSVNSGGQTNIDVSEFALIVDRVLSDTPAKVAFLRSLAKSRPRSVSVRAKQSYPLIKNLKREAPSDGWLKVIAPDGELGRKNNTLTYVSDQTGRKKIEVYVIRAEPKQS